MKAQILIIIISQIKSLLSSVLVLTTVLLCVPRLVSTVHALVVGLFCLYILWFDDVVNADPVW